MHPLYIIRTGQSFLDFMRGEFIKARYEKFMPKLNWHTRMLDAGLSLPETSLLMQRRSCMDSLPVRKIFVSPMARARETCLLLFGNHPQRPIITVCPHLTDQVQTISDVSLMMKPTLPLYRSWDWSMLGGVPYPYWQLDVVTAQKFQSLWSWRSSSHKKFIERTSKLIAQLHPKPLETIEEMVFRLDHMKILVEKDLKKGPVVLVGHKVYFEQFLKKWTEPVMILENYEVKNLALK